MNRAGRAYTLDEVLPKVGAAFASQGPGGRKVTVEFDGHFIKMTSERLLLFYHRGTTCVACGVTGDRFYKEGGQGQSTYHFNLYAPDGKGGEVLMTADHIVPESKGGKRSATNLQVMCAPCNVAKGAKLEPSGATELAVFFEQPLGQLLRRLLQLHRERLNMSIPDSDADRVFHRMILECGVDPKQVDALLHASR